MTESLNRYAPYALAALRIVAALLFMEHGTVKLFGFPDTGRGGGELDTLHLIAGLLEVFGGLALVIGLFTRPVAFLLSGQMAIAYWMVHFKPEAFFPIQNHGDGAILFCFVFLYLVFAGSGAWSVDGMRKANP
ncbi:DoxX family protein [Methyloligella sp. 2.7D]|uniref:DoxX family protein n=1 Tax=unclassified Methyloligella TaxID=2625955 RepID=UPI00157D6931|nr:DoxX family protein [Methyloligella sp. GL2]QKP77411.1 DoxX family protein [Methyloligella sp. GL2]